MAVHIQAIKALAPADYLLIEREHALLENFLHDLRSACACSNLDNTPDCKRCDHEMQASCKGRLPSFLYYLIELAANHFEHEEAIMLSRPHVTESYEYFRIHQQAHVEIMRKLNALVDECFTLDNDHNPAEVYIRFYEQLSAIFEEHDQAFDDPFILSTQH
jgi:hemerythrin